MGSSSVKFTFFWISQLLNSLITGMERWSARTRIDLGVLSAVRDRDPNQPVTAEGKAWLNLGDAQVSISA